mmetsp:Transcript_8338/g.8311  ORF Transcript_8338/g.8311 Transcript_8338/m.8311 type:complete len:218 (-) Transcript_8338:743-1396(-)
MQTNLFQFFTFVALFFLHVSSIDLHSDCAFWAEGGECEVNPDFMLEECSESCNVKQEYLNDIDAETFYDIVEKDIHGTELNFESFKGRVVYIVNVASQCGYTEENYDMFRNLRKYRMEGLEVLIAPCNQFGSQEPGDEGSISSFVKKQEFVGILLSKSDVNGPRTRPLFTYLKRVTGKGKISWNFDGKFLCSREGKCAIPGPDVEKEIVSLLRQEQL